MGSTSTPFHGHGASFAGARKASRSRTWFLRVATSLLAWALVVQLTSVVDLRPSRPLPEPCSAGRLGRRGLDVNATNLSVREEVGGAAKGGTLASSPPAVLPRRVYKSNGYLHVSCNGGLNQMRAAICDMVTVARFLNLTLVIPELDKTSFWGDPSDFKDVFNVKHFIESLRDEVKIIRTLPPKFNRKLYANTISMAPVSWSNEKYYLKQILPIFRKHKIIHFNKADARLANNGLPINLQKLRCRVNYEALRFTPQIHVLGEKLISALEKGGKFLVLHLRYEMDMLAFSGCTHGSTDMEAEELTKMRYAYPWWKEKEIVSEEKRLNGLCPLTPEEIALVLQALDFTRDTKIYIASGEIYGGERRLSALRAAFPNIVRKETLLHPDELRPLMNHSTQMAALDYIVSIASDVFIPSYDGNMAKVVEGHRRYLGFQRTILLNRKELVKLLDSYQDGSISWADFSNAVKEVHKHRIGQPARRKVISDRPKEEDYFYANPQECLGPILSREHRIFDA